MMHCAAVGDRHWCAFFSGFGRENARAALCADSAWCGVGSVAGTAGGATGGGATGSATGGATGGAATAR